MKKYLCAACVALAPLVSACSTGHDHYYDDGSYCPYGGPTSVLRVDIDTDQPLEADPKNPGVGLFVDYAAGGTWHLATTCDTVTSNATCDWVVTASVDPALSVKATDDGNLESDDVITRVNKGAVELHLTTDVDVDSVTLTAPAGEALRLSVLLDGCYEPSFVDWIANGTLKTGAPSDPVELVPTTP